MIRALLATRLAAAFDLAFFALVTVNGSTNIGLQAAIQEGKNRPCSSNILSTFLDLWCCTLAHFYFVGFFVLFKVDVSTSSRRGRHIIVSPQFFTHHGSERIP
jgi:hypothetical protein